MVLPPPPIEAEDRIRAFPGRNETRFENAEIEDAAFRLELYRKQCEVTRRVADNFGIPVVELPESVLTDKGFLVPECWGNDPTHGNEEYGKRVLPVIVGRLAKECETSGGRGGERARPSHPYVGLPDYCYWKQSIGETDASSVDPVTSVPFRIGRNDRVATAGSCFAQHISKRLRDSGFNFYVAEKTDGDEEEGRVRGFYDFSARYGNIYTARQLVQLFDRAFGYFAPIDKVWPRHGGGYCDPFRPRIEPEGFPTEEAVVRDSRRHLAAVRRMFQRLDVFVFTLGLTECWLSKLDGAAYPVAPGVVGGQFDPRQHVFANFSAADVVRDLADFLRKLEIVNPKAKVILTVSPVPLVATAEDRHVLVSTTYSKAVLRVAAEEICRSHGNVMYFPSYEIITGQHVGNDYYGPDRRSVTERGVDHVMGIFMAKVADRDAPVRRRGADQRTAAADRILAEMEALAEAACDEEMLEK
jgi:hypothetical protein